jgi:ketosteroid isomerase-like protein
MMRANLRRSNGSLLWTVLVFAAALLLILAAARAARTQAATSKHLTAEQALDLQKRFQDATVADDTAAIRELMADDAIFVHGNALVQTKAEFLEAATKRQFRIKKYEIKNAKVVLFEGGAIISGVEDISLAPRAVGEQPAEVQMRVSSVWVAKPAGWQLILNQGTPIQAAPAAAAPNPASR